MLDYWEHVESIKFSKGRCPAKFLEARSPGRRPLRAKVGRRFFAEIEANPDREFFLHKAAGCCREETWTAITNSSTTSYCLVRLVCWRSRGGGTFLVPPRILIQAFLESLVSSSASMAVLTLEQKLDLGFGFEVPANEPRH